MLSRRALLISVLAIAVVALFWRVAARTLPGGDTGRSAAAVDDPVAPAPQAVRPVWPRMPGGDPAAEADAWRPSIARFPDGSTLLLVPERVRSAWGRTLTVGVERRDVSGQPISGILDMELIVDTPGRQPFKLGFTERRGAPGTYKTVVPADQLGIGRTDLLIMATQSGRPGQPGAMASALAAVDVTAGVRLTGPVTARRENGRLLIDVGVSSRAVAQATVTAELRAGGEVVAEISGDAQVAEGGSVITLDAGDLIAADDPRAGALALADATVLTSEAGSARWTDFWRGERSVAQAQ